MCIEIWHAVSTTGNDPPKGGESNTRLSLRTGHEWVTHQCRVSCCLHTKNNLQQFIMSRICFELTCVARCKANYFRPFPDYTFSCSNINFIVLTHPTVTFSSTFTKYWPHSTSWRVRMFVCLFSSIVWLEWFSLDVKQLNKIL